MKKINFIILFLFVLFFSVNKSPIYSQKYEINKITLYIIPFNTNEGFDIPYNSVKKYSTVKINIKDWAVLSSISPKLYSISCETIVDMNKDFRVFCIIHWGYKRDFLYFNSYGHFLYQGKSCRNEALWSFIISNIPDIYK
jgi:hypothetical protein